MAAPCEREVVLYEVDSQSERAEGLIGAPKVSSQRRAARTFTRQPRKAVVRQQARQNLQNDSPHDLTVESLCVE